MRLRTTHGPQEELAHAEALIAQYRKQIERKDKIGEAPAASGSSDSSDSGNIAGVAARYEAKAHLF